MNIRLFWGLFLLVFGLADELTSDNCIQVQSSKWCFSFYEELLNFKDALKKCEHLNSSLATIPNAAVNELVVRYLNKTNNRATSTWIGLQWSHSILRWTSGYPAVVNTFWKDSTVKLNGKCSAILTDGLWEAYDCNETRPFLCSSEKKDSSVAAPFLDISKYECPPNFHLLGRRCLRFFVNELATRDEAEVACAELNAHLLTIQSFIDQDIVVAMLADHVSSFWLGLDRNGSRYSWSNPSETDVLFTNWMVDEPNRNPSFNCTLMHMSSHNLGQWSQIRCSFKAHFICDAKPKLAPAHSDHHLHGGLFVRGRCANGFYEYRSACYSVIHLSFEVTRSATMLSDAVTAACQNTVSEKTCVPPYVGSALCPKVMTPHDRFDTAFLRPLIDKFGIPSKAAWVGLKANQTHVYFDEPEHLESTSLLDHSLHGDLANKNVCIALSVEKLLLHSYACDSYLPVLCGYRLDAPLVNHLNFKSDEDLQCPDSNWKLFGANCYHFDGSDTRGLSWHDAEVTCVRQGGHLLSISTEAEDHFIRSLLSTTQPSKIWIGLKLYIEPIGGLLMEWSDDRPVNYSPFHTNVSTDADEECVQLSKTSSSYVWTPVSDCNEPAPFVCKTMATPKSMDWDSMGLNHCSHGSHPEFCFSVNNTEVKFVKAVQACQVVGQHVATILDDSHQDFVRHGLRMLLSPELNKNTSQRFWIGLLRSHGTLQWVSGYPAVPNVFWKTGVENSEGICVYLDVGIDNMLSWGTADCEDEYPFLCSNVPPLPPPSSSVDESHTSCPLGFLYVNGKCYKVEGDTQNMFTFAEAEVKCSRSGGHLVTISSMHEQDTISVLVAERFLSFWIGLNMTVEGRQWVNGAPITYTNWMEGHPSLRDYRNHLCTYVRNLPAHIGRWAETKCNEKMGFICETKPTEPLTQQQTVVTPHLFSQDDCALGFVHHRGACYLLIGPKSNRSASELYDDVSAECAVSLNSSFHLPCSKARGLAGCPVIMTPHSQAEAAFMRLLIGSNGYAAEAWTGLKILFNNSLAITQTEDRVTLGVFDIDFVNLNDDGSTAYTCFALRADRTFLSARPCFHPAPAICGYYLDTHHLHPQLVSADDFDCPADTERVGRSCFYHVKGDKKMNWYDAEEYCLTLGHEVLFAAVTGDFAGHLPAIHDPLTLQFIAKLHENEPAWLGLTAFLELRSDLNDSRSSPPLFHWSDSSPVDYVAFAPATGKRIDLHFVNENPHTCIALDSQSSLWKTVSCYERLAFSCQFPIEAFPKHHLANDIKYLPTVTQCPADFVMKTKNACYAMGKAPLSAGAALTSCATLHPQAKLASFHSEQEQNDALALIGKHHQKGTYWTGLSQSGLQFSWADSSVVDYIPEALMTLKPVHFWSLHDCFTLTSPGNATDVSLTGTWDGADCSGAHNFICQIYHGPQGPLLIEPTSPVRPNLSPLRCPPGYRQLEDRCFKFYALPASFDNAGSICMKTVEGSKFIGSLARISNSLEQDFVAGLFAAEATLQPSRAWIGLRQGGKQWTDGTKVTFFRRTLGLASVSLHEEGNCTVLLYSSNVLFNGLWSTAACSITDQIYFVCQAVPVSPAAFLADGKVEVDYMKTKRLVCGDGYSLGLFNSTALALKQQIPPPHCYQLVGTEPMTWQDARSLCKDQSASLPSIDTLADLNFFRTWLQTPRSLGGAGLSSNTSVWLDLRVPTCPMCYSNWHWHAGEADEAPVQFVDWVQAPQDPSGCYFYTVAPFSSITLRSIRPAASCDVSLPVVCQKSLNLVISAKIPAGTTEGRCMKNPTPELSTAPSFNTSRSVARSGRDCIRWDLVERNLNLSGAFLPTHWPFSAVNIAYSEHANPFWENRCAHLAMTDANGETSYRYACYTSTNSVLGLEDCDMDRCDTSLLPLGWIIFIALACLAICVAITLCVVRMRNRNHFNIPSNPWVSPLKMTSSSSVFGHLIPTQQQSRRQHGVFYSNGSGDPGAPSVQMFDASGLIASDPSPLHSLVPSLTFKRHVYRPLHDQDPLLLDEPDNADEFAEPV